MKTSREKAIEWWGRLSFEDSFYITIKNNNIIEGDKTRNPNSLTGREIEEIYKAENARKEETVKK